MTTVTIYPTSLECTFTSEVVEYSLENFKQTVQ